MKICTVCMFVGVCMCAGLSVCFFLLILLYVSKHLTKREYSSLSLSVSLFVVSDHSVGWG